MIRTMLSAVAALFLAVAPAHAQTAVVRGLDKVTGHARDYQLPVGRSVRIGTLEVVARSCRRSAPEDPPEVQIYVEVFDHLVGQTAEGEELARAEIFHGWLFASSPGLNAIEHPVYDLWSIDCRA